MSRLNGVEVRKVRVEPLAEWKYILSRSPLRRCPWPASSDRLCWWCCHAFDNVPAFLPVRAHLDASHGIAAFVFAGNFCSWNCVKGYAMMLEQRRKAPDGCHYIGILAFLTVCKTATPCEGAALHEMGLCECVAEYRGIAMPADREALEAFGGTVSIEEFRRGFHRIASYKNVRRNFGDVVGLQQSIRSLPNARCWDFRYLDYKGPGASHTSYVDVLPLTNRTVDKATLVTTGQEETCVTRRLDAGAGPAGHNGKRRASGAAAAPKRLQRRGTKARAPEPLPTARDPPPPTAPAASIMSTEQVLACNEEQHFYTSSLRGYGNILTSMGIEISRPPQRK
jgi:hypothetical protein